jgi:hypothetical protein
VGALEDLPHGPLLAAAVVDADHRSEHPVAVQDAAHLAWRQVKVRVALVGYQETETVRVRADAAGDEVHAGRQAVRAAAVLDQLAVPHHGLQAAPEDLAAAFAVDAQAFDDLTPLQRRAVVFEQFDDGPALGGVPFQALAFRVVWLVVFHGCIVALFLLTSELVVSTVRSDSRVPPRLF